VADLRPPRPIGDLPSHRLHFALLLVRRAAADLGQGGQDAAAVLVRGVTLDEALLGQAVEHPRRGGALTAAAVTARCAEPIDQKGRSGEAPRASRR
jgi:hypothetical protein